MDNAKPFQHEIRQQVVDGKLRTTMVLATLLVRMQNGTCISKPLRALLDPGSQMNIITMQCAKRLKLPLLKCSQSAHGLFASTKFNKKVKICLRPWYDSDASITIELFISDQLSGTFPAGRLDMAALPDKKLADPRFNAPAPVDMLFGVDVYARLVLPLIYEHSDGGIMQETNFGFIILGRWLLEQDTMADLGVFMATTDKETIELNGILEKFWDHEEIQTHKRIRSPEQEAVESFFVSTHKRDAQGRYVVKIPIKPGGLPIADSRDIALRRFYQLERRLQREPELKDKYVAFMREFIALGHMQLAKSKPVPGWTAYTPHHAVLEKFRTVFDASCLNVAGNSLNKIQLLGEKLQFDLQDQIMRFRRYKYAVIADIEKMFRQVCIDESQWDLQRILWRESPYAPLLEYVITRVMYGMTSATHLSTRAMIQCGRDNAESFPKAAEAIEKCFYVDDGLLGGHTTQETKLLCQEVDFVLRTAGMELRNWISNSREVQRSMEKQSAQQSIDLRPDDEETKVLELRWLTATDDITIFVRSEGLDKLCTKREVLSGIGRLYDPNGYIAPIIIIAKILMQDVWRKKELGWDDELPISITNRWQEIVMEIVQLPSLRIPRWIRTGNSQSQLHGFCDASSHAYGAVIYARVIDRKGKIGSFLLCAKSRVAPIKTISIPRLELSGAEMLSRLAEHVRDICEMENAKLYLWCDSTIVLHWMQKMPFELKTFVANRIALIQGRTQTETWSHIESIIDSANNPADLITRGMKASELISSSLWKHGPHFLRQAENTWPTPKLTVSPQMVEQVELECKPKGGRIGMVISSMCHKDGLSLLQTKSSWFVILRITAYVRRFVYNASCRDYKKRIIRKWLSAKEIEEAAFYWVRVVQAEHYSKEIESLKQAEDGYPAHSKIASLRPMFGNGLLRVGGRIGKAGFKYLKKHPLIVPPGSRLCWLIMQQTHEDTLHGGVQLMMAMIRNVYWIPTLRNECKKFVRRCVVCVRQAGITSQQIMSALPAERIRPARPFANTGVDLAGPYMLKLSDKLNMSTRSRSKLDEDLKGYIAVFVCLVTRAVHLEPVTDLSAEAFLAAYTRFTAKRGNPNYLFSDNGRNFVKADKILKQAVQVWRQDGVQHFINKFGTEWKFITPSAPHQGGLWEAAVKQMKAHLRRVIGPHKYTFEGIYTLLAGVEACMNSRPICAMSDDPDDLAPLTPAHFISGGPLRLPLPEKCEPPPKMALSLYRSIQSQIDTFWKLWADEYIGTLMERNKWQNVEPNLQVGQLVLIKSENLAPTYWPIGRVTATKAGDDGSVRSATIKVFGGSLDRPVQKLCILPVDDAIDHWT